MNPIMINAIGFGLASAAIGSTIYTFYEAARVLAKNLKEAESEALAQGRLEGEKLSKATKGGKVEQAA